MNFSELEYILMIAVAVLLWRNSVLRAAAAHEERRANKYAGWMMGIHDKKGRVVHKDNAYYYEETPDANH
jgi:hypothetical protein